MKKSIFQVFEGDEQGQQHARQWAASTYGETYAQTFVDWLLSLTMEEQDRIWFNGYPDCRDAFEAAHPEVLP